MLGMFVIVATWFSGIARPGMKDCSGDLCRSGYGLMWTGFSNRPRTEGWPGMISCALQGQLNWKGRWRTWCAERLGLVTGGIASAEAVQLLAGKEVWNYHISSGGAGGQPRPRQWLTPRDIGMRMLSPHFACHRFGVRSRDPFLWSPRRCGVISCTRVNVATKISRFGDVANEGGQHPACSRESGMPANRDLMRRIWAAHGPIPTLGFRRMKVLCSVQVSDNLQMLFKRQRESEAPGEAAVQGPEVWVPVPSRVPIQTTGVRDNKQNNQVLGPASHRQEMVRSSRSQRRPRPSPGRGSPGSMAFCARCSRSPRSQEEIAGCPSLISATREDAWRGVGGGAKF